MRIPTWLFAVAFAATALLGLATSSVAHADVLVAGATSVGWLPDVQSKIQATGLVSGNVDTFDISTATPTLAQLQAYQAVLVFTDTAAADPVALGDNLADYVDAGGGVVFCAFGTVAVITGRWQSGGYSPHAYGGGGHKWSSHDARSCCAARSSGDERDQHV